MQLEANENLDRLIREEKHRVAKEFFQEAWNGAVQEGIESSILAESAVVIALTRLHSSEGEKQVTGLLDSLIARLESGHFDPDRKLQ